MSELSTNSFLFHLMSVLMVLHLKVAIFYQCSMHLWPYLNFFQTTKEYPYKEMMGDNKKCDKLRK